MTTLNKDQIVVDADKVTLKSLEVTNSIVTEQQIALEQIATTLNYPTPENPTTIRLSDVSIDSNGYVVISNKKVAEAASKGGGISFNWKCNFE